MPYSISRNTGWKLGVHPPLAVMRYGLTNPPINMTRHGLTPVYIIMLRNPFDRFMSEVMQWMSRPGQTVDWSIVNEARGKKFLYRGIDPQSLSDGTTPADMEKNIKLYAGLPGHFIFHNRQIKTVGGTVYDFDMYFDPQEDLGSRWRPKKADYIGKVAERAYHVISRNKDVLFGVQHRFAELICLLEVLYGRLYRFAWEPDVHSHNAAKKYEGPTSRTNANAYSEVYSIWVKNNAADEHFYSAAEKLFQVQFDAGLSVLKKRIEEEGTGTLKRTPHCKAFLS
jgi:hypothetical protein